MDGALPEGGAISLVLSVSKARKAVAEELVAVEPVASAMAGEDGYAIGPDGFDDKGLAAIDAGLSAS